MPSKQKERKGGRSRGQQFAAAGEEEEDVEGASERAREGLTMQQTRCQGSNPLPLSKAARSETRRDWQPKILHRVSPPACLAFPVPPLDG